MANTARPAARPAARAAKAAPAPVDDFEGFGSEGFEGFEDEAPSAEAEGFEGFEDAEEGVQAPGGDEFDGFGDEPQADEGGDFDGFEDEPQAEAEPEVPALAPKLADGNYRLPKGTPAFYVDSNDDGEWIKSIKVEDNAAKDIKVSYEGAVHGVSAVTGLEDKPGKTFVVLGYKEFFIVTIAEKLLTLKGQPVEILAEEPVEEAPVEVAAPRGRGKAKAEAAAPAPALSAAQTKALKALKSALAAVEAAFGEI